MDVEQNNQRNMSQQLLVKTSKLAIWSFVLAILSFFTFMITAIPAIVCGIIGIKRINLNQEILKGKKFAVAGIVISLLGLFIFIGLMLPANGAIREGTRVVICKAHLTGLGSGISAYLKENNNIYPPAENWTNSLKEYADAKLFKCPLVNNKEEQTSYAYNIYLAGENASDVPVNTVLLFETTRADNHAGGPELLSIKKHYCDGEGCNVLFTDGQVKFVKKEDLKNLRWKP
jgi:prepilin-type processing-associated H-X9-DG protein